MAQLIALEVIIDGSLTVASFSYLSINQTINNHHSFELRFDDDIEQGGDEVSINKYQKYLGKSITLNLGENLYGGTKTKDNIFKGIITEISMVGTPVDAGGMVIKGSSPTILLDTHKNCNVFLDKNLQQIVSKVVENAPTSDLKINVAPQNSKQIPYLVQYNETDYDFLRRLANDYGEWFFYNGQELFFGKPALPPAIELKYPVNVSDMTLSVKAQPLGFEMSSYNLSKAKEIFRVKSSSVSSGGLGAFGDAAANVSAKLYGNNGDSPAPRGLAEMGLLESFVKSRKAALSSTLAVLKANSDSSALFAGALVKMSKYSGNLGGYIVTNVHHITDSSGNYSNFFEAIPDSVSALPMSDVERPLIEPQVGVVVDNKDPKGLGRVKVILFWQAETDKGSLPWMRVMTGSAGKYGSQKNRGIHFTPEIDETVMVGFTENDPSMPFVMGSISLDDARDSNSNKDNFEKIIRTRSGNTIYFRDKENSQEQEVRIETDKTNYISILVKNGDGNIEIKSTKEISVESTKTINVKSETITIEAVKDIVMKANNNITMSANGNIDISGTKGVTAKGTQISIQGTATTEVKANGQLNLQSAGQASLKGAIVMIN